MTPAAHRRRWSRQTMELLPRLERQVQRLHRLGPRPTLELLLELAAKENCLPTVAAAVATYAAIDGKALRETGGDRIPPRRLLEAPRP